MQMNKVMSVAVAFLMIAVGCSVAAFDSSVDASAADGLATYKFWIATDADADWTVKSADGYNAYDALVSVPNSNVNSSSYTITVGTYPNDYQTINPYYGTVTNIFGNGGDDGYEWYVFIYSIQQNSWISGPIDAIGFYQAYDDYDLNLRTANIALYYSTDSDISDLPSLPTTSTDLSPIKSVGINDDNYKVKFNIQINSNMTTKPGYMDQDDWQNLLDSVGTYYGYGSNGFTALLNATSNTTGNGFMYNTSTYSVNNSSYGYVDCILGTPEHSIYSDVTEQVSGGTLHHVTSTWYYWALYYVSGNTSVYSNFTAGFMSPLAGLPSPFVESEFTYEFVESVYQYDWLEEDL